MIALWSGFGVATSAYLLRHDPALLAERLRSSPVQGGQKRWDKVLMLMLTLAGVAFYIVIVPAFDVMRFSWSERLPVWVEVSALAAQPPLLALIG